MTKIEWCDKTWNPVVGCTHGCEYCYARKMSHRIAHMQAGRWIKDEKNSDDFALLIDRVNEENSEGEINHILDEATPVWCQDCHDFKPHAHLERLDQLNPNQKPKRIFSDSMFDWNCVDNKKEWLDAILKKMEECNQHTFQILSKRPHGYRRFQFPKNVWLGTTLTSGFDKSRGRQLTRGNKENLKFLSIEPLHGWVGWEVFRGIDWVIIGAETGTRKGKITPELPWIYDILATCANNKIPVFIKDNLLKLYPELPKLQKFPAV